MRTQLQIEKAEDTGSMLQDFILLSKTQQRLKSPQLIDKEIEDLRLKIISMINKF